MIALALGVALAGPPTVADWQRTLGDPSKPVAASNEARNPDEPLLLYWMQTRAAPLGVGPALPGTLVANFTAAEDPTTGALRDFTFLAVASPDEVAALTAAIAPWVVSEADEVRPGGTFHVFTLSTPDGGEGTVSIRQGAAAGAMADGRPSPTLWMYVSVPG